MRVTSEQIKQQIVEVNKMIAENERRIAENNRILESLTPPTTRPETRVVMVD